MFVQREFKLISGRRDYQYVSSVDSRGYPKGYDKSKECALNLSEWHLKRVTSYFNDIGAKWTESLS